MNNTALDDFERDYREGIGVEVDLNPERFLVEASRDGIKNFCEAVGDGNPLWINEAYARKSRFGGITAPPTFLYNVNHGTSPAIGLPGAPPSRDLALLYAGAEREFYRPVRLGDELNVKGKALGIERKPSRSLGRLLFTNGEATYSDGNGEPLGAIRTTICRFNIPGKQAVRFDRRPRPGVEAKSPDLLAFERVRRGAEPRFWEDVEVGMEMAPPLEKGLLTMTEIFRFGLFVPSVPRRIERRCESIGVGFQREAMQKRSGLENASDYGPQRVCWLGQLATDWMGDDGTLKRMSCQVRHPSIIGDVNTVKGRVKGKRIQGGEHLVDCEIWVENQAGLVTAPGEATVSLPSRK
jgi:acyl dehydratase